MDELDHLRGQPSLEQDLGCPPIAAFWKVTFPLSLAGVVAGCMLVFIPAVGEFVIPDLLGGSATIMLGQTLWMEFFSNRDWPVASPNARSAARPRSRATWTTTAPCSTTATRSTA